MKTKFFIFTILIHFSSSLMAYVDINHISSNSKLDITVNTSFYITGGQRILLSLNSDGDIYEYIIKASTGNQGYPTDDFNGHPYELKESYSEVPYNYEFSNAVFYFENLSIYSIPLQQFHTSNEGQRSGADCLTEGLACTRGSVGLWPHDAKFIFDIVKKIGFQNTTIRISKDSEF